MRSRQATALTSLVACRSIWIRRIGKFKSASQPDLNLVQSMVGQSPKRANVRVLVQNGEVVLPVTIREVPTGAAAAGKNAKMPTKPVQEITIAVDPEEVAVLSEAMVVSANMVCVARSGQPDDPGASSITPGSDPGPKLHTMETIAGGKRQTLIFLGPNQPPQPAPEAGSDDPAPGAIHATPKAQ